MHTYFVGKFVNLSPWILLTSLYRKMNKDGDVMNNNIMLHTCDVVLKQRAASIIKDIGAVKFQKSIQFGLKLGLPNPVIEDIHQRFEPNEHLLHMLEEFLKQENPIPTWRVIIDTFKSSEIALPQLAERCKKKHLQKQDGMLS